MARKALPAPTLAYLSDLKQELITEYALQDAELLRDRRVRMLEQPVPLADEDRLVDLEVRDPTIADEAQRAQATLSLNRATLTCRPPRESDAADENATLRQEWTEQVLWHAGRRTPGVDTYRDMVDAAVNDGGAWTKLLWVPDDWSSAYDAQKQGDSQQAEDAKKAAGPPFVWRHVDTLTIYPVWQGMQLGEVMEVTERPLHQVFRQYRLGLTEDYQIVPEETGLPEAEWRHQLNYASGLNARNTVLFVEHWDREWATYLVLAGAGSAIKGGYIVKQFKHKYGRVPYVYMPGLTMNFWKNRKLGWGISRTKRWLSEYKSYLLTMHAQYVHRDLLAPLFRSVPDTAAPLVGEDGEPILREDGPAPGEVLVGRPGEDVKRIDYPVPANLVQHIEMVEQAIQALSSPKVTTLNGLEGAGFAVAQILSEFRLRFDPISQNIESGLRDLTRFLWQLARERVKETIYVQRSGKTSGWLGAGPDDLTDTVGVEWRLEPERATDDLIKSRYASERLANRTWGLNEAIEYLGDSPDEIRRSTLRDQIRQSQPYQQLLMQSVLQEAGRGDLLGQAAEAMQLATQGEIPGRGQQMPNGAGTPDFGALATAPNGQGAAPTGGPNLGMAGAQQMPPLQSLAGGMQSVQV